MILNIGEASSKSTQEGGASANLAGDASNAPSSGSRMARVITLTPNSMNVVVLPKGVELDDIEVQGRDLVIHAGDGRVYIIPDGAIEIPQLMLDGIVVPPINLAVLLTSEAVQPAAGTTSSSGGNFADPVEPIQNAFDLGDLLPYTELFFPLGSDDEIIPGLTDLTPEIGIEIGDSGIAVADAVDEVSEAGLPARNGEPAGSNSDADSETTFGYIVFNAPDGPGTVSINGTTIIAVGQTVTTDLGLLKIISIEPGRIGYSYLLTDNTLDPALRDHFTVVVTDRDGDKAFATLQIKIINDAPSATDEASQNVPEGTTVSGAFDFVQGADGASLTHINGSAVSFNPDGWSNWIDLGAGDLRVKADGSYQFRADTVTTSPVAPITGTFTVTDGDKDTASAGFAFQITDANTPTGGSAAAAVDDDGLAAGNPASTVGDIDANLGDAPGDTSEATFTGTLGGSVGLDGAGANGFGFGANTTGTVGLETVSYSVSGNVLTATVNAGPRSGTALFKVEITDPTTGAYKVTLLANVLHEGGPNNEGINATAAIAYTITDADGSSVPGNTLTITFNDDAPSATDEASQNVPEGTTVSGAFDFVQGADGASLTHINGSAVSFNPDGWSNWIDLGAGDLRVKADGSYQFRADTVTTSPVAPITGTFTVTDGDKDTASAGFAFQITDANTPTGGSAAAAVDDDGLAAGNPASTVGDIDANLGDAPGDTSEATFTGTLGGSVGLDGAGANGFGFGANTTGTVGLETVSYSVSGNVLTATVNAGPRSGTALFKVEITDPTTGAYKVTLLANVLHEGGPNNEGINATAAIAYTITDADGSSVPGNTLTITFNDDAPSATDEASQNVPEGTTVSGAFDFVQGADGASLTHINGSAVSFNPDGWSNWIDLGAGDLRVKADGSYQFRADTVTTSPVAPITGTFTVTDGDKDTASAGFAFQITDANTPTGGSAAAAVDDDGLAAGNPASTVGDIDANLGDAPGDTSEATFTGTLGGSVGLDGAGANGFGFGANTTGTVGLETVSYSVSGNVLTATVNAGPRSGTALFKVEITDPTTGAYKVTLLANVLHEGGPNNEGINATAAIAYTITDADGSSVPGNTLTITFNDDAPSATDEASQNVPEGTTVSGAFDFVQGADGASLTHINGSAVSFNPDGWSNWIDLGAGDLRVKADGSYQFRADTVTTSPVAPITGTFTVTDGDKDTASAGFAFQITDANTPTGGSAAAAVDDDGLAAGNPASTVGDIDANLGDAPGDTSEATFTGTLGGSVGLDGAGANGFGFGANTTGTVGLETVSYSVSGNVLTATVNAGPRSGTALFKVEITDPTTGAYKVTLLANVLHEGGPNNEGINATAAIAYTITDADGSSVPGNTLTITFNDDAPSATDEASQNVPEGTTVSGAFDFVQGADGASLTHINGSAVSFNPDGWSNWIDLGAGDLRVKADGSYQFRADTVTTSPVAPITGTFTVTDGDKDTASAGFAFQITDANTPTGGSAAAAVDDDGLAAGNPASTVGDIDANLGDAPGDTSEATFTGTLGGSVGLDGAGANGFGFGANTTGTVGLETVSYSVSGNVLTATVNAGPRSGTALFKVEITDPTTGAYKVTLLANVLHEGGPNNEGINATAAIAYTITDADGSSVPGNTLTITFNDDAPSANNVTPIPVLDDDAQAHGNLGGTGDVPNATTTNGAAGTLFVAGADGAKSIVVTGPAMKAIYVDANGFGQQQTVTWTQQTAANGQVTLTGSTTNITTVATLTVNADGSWSYTQFAPVLNPISGTTEETTNFGFGLTVTDGDNDTVSSTLTIQINDDTPMLGVIQNQQASNDPTQTPAVGTLHFSPGADGAGSTMTIGAINLAGIKSGGFNIVTNQVGNVLTGYADKDQSGSFSAGDTEVFRLTVNPTTGSSGQYTFDLIAPLDPKIVDTPIGSSSAFGAGPTASQILSTTGGTNLAVVSGWETGAGFDATNWFNGANTLPSGLTLSSVNGSTNGWGVKNQNFNGNEFMRFDFGSPMDDFDGAGPYTTPSVTLPEVSFAVFDFIGFSSTEILQFRIHYTDGTSSNAQVTGPGTGYTFTAPTGKFIDWIDIYGPNVGNGSGKIDLVSVGVRSATVDSTLNFTLQLTDGDGDATCTTAFSVRIADGLSPSTPVAPVVLDLDGDGVQFLGMDAGVLFDYIGDGSPVATAWAAPGDGFLARMTTAGLDIVFTDDAPGAKTDLEGLQLAFDSDGDSWLTAADDAWNSFGVWRDANSNGVVDDGEFVSLEAAGISAIQLVSDGVGYSAASGDVQVYGSANFIINGQSRPLADAAFATASTDRQALRTVDATMVALAATGLIHAEQFSGLFLSPHLTENQPSMANSQDTVAELPLDSVLAGPIQLGSVFSGLIGDDGDAVPLPLPSHSNMGGDLDPTSKDVANDLADALLPWSGQQADMADEPLGANVDHDPGYGQLMDALLGIVGPNLDTDVLPGQAAIVAEVVHDALADAFQISVIDDLVNAFTPIESGSAPVPDRADVDFSDLLAASLNVSHVSDGIPFDMVQTADDIAVQAAQNA